MSAAQHVLKRLRRVLAVGRNVALAADEPHRFRGIFPGVEDALACRRQALELAELPARGVREKQRARPNAGRVDSRGAASFLGSQEAGTTRVRKFVDARSSTIRTRSCCRRHADATPAATPCAMAHARHVDAEPRSAGSKSSCRCPGVHGPGRHGSPFWGAWRGTHCVMLLSRPHASVRCYFPGALALPRLLLRLKT